MESSVKKYKLLKDLPNTSKGAIFDLVREHYHCGYHRIYKSVVENNPEWFEEVKKEKPIEFKVYDYDINPTDEYTVIVDDVLTFEEAENLKKKLEQSIYLTEEEITFLIEVWFKDISIGYPRDIIESLSTKLKAHLERIQNSND